MTTHVVTVIGIPAGQGRISFDPHSRRGYHSNRAKLHPWRDAIRAAAQAVIAAPLEGPVSLEATITVPKPVSAPKTRTTWPVTRTSGDWDHHGRAISDALTGVAYLDDSQVVEGLVAKVYPGEGIDALDQPGAVIRITPLGGNP